jgi:hypothetical protein
MTATDTRNNRRATESQNEMKVILEACLGVSLTVKTLGYKQEGRGFDTRRD